MKKTFEDIDPIPVCKRFEELRMKLGFSNKSKFCRQLGISPQTYQKYEEDRIPPSDVLCKLALIFMRDVDFLWLLTGIESPAAPPKSSPLDPTLLKQIIDGVEEHLKEKKKKLDSEIKSRLIALLYDYYSQSDEKVNKVKVANYLKLVA